MLIGATLTALARSSYRLYTGISRLIKSFFDLTFSFKDLFPSLLLTFPIAMKIFVLAPGYEIVFCMEGNVNAPDLELRLGPPEVEVADGLSPVERRIRTRFSIYEPGRYVPIEDLRAIVHLKGEIIARMSQLDPDPFWMEHRDRIISESILTPKGPEYKLAALQGKLVELQSADAPNSDFFKRLKGIRDHYRWTGKIE